MTASQTIQDRIATLIALWTTSKEEQPPFTAEELIVTTLLFSNETPMTPRETFHGITTIFPYYHEQAVMAFYKIPYGSIMPPQHKKHIEHVTLVYAPYAQGKRSGDAAFKALRQLGSLRKLDIRIDEERWTNLAKNDARRKHTSATGMPGFKELSELRGLEEVVFRGCPTIEKMLREDMLKSRMELGKKAKGVKKRKAVDGDDDTEVRKSGGAKRAKAR